MPSFHFTPFPELSAGRLDLRRVGMEDAGAIFILRSDERMTRYVDIPKAQNLDDAMAFITKIDKGIENDQWINWGIYLKGCTKLIGTVCLWNIMPDATKAETGYMLLPDFQGKGYMQEALEMVIEYGFKTMGLGIIEAYTHINNDASTRMLKKFNFVTCAAEDGKDLGNDVIFALTKPVAH